MVLAGVTSEVQNFWVPVAQIAPVFALALVLEARRIASTWMKTARRSRRIQGIAIFLAGNILWLVEWRALTAMALQESDSLTLWLSVVGLSAVFIGMCLSPLSGIVVAANADLFLVLERLVPGSSWSKNRRQLNQLEKIMAETARHAVATIDATERSLELSNQVVKLYRQNNAGRAVIRERIEAVEAQQARSGKPYDEDQRTALEAAKAFLADDEELDIDEAKCGRKEVHRDLKRHYRRLLSLDESIRLLEELKNQSSLFHMSEVDHARIELALAQFSRRSRQAAARVRFEKARAESIQRETTAIAGLSGNAKPHDLARPSA